MAFLWTIDDRGWVAAPLEGEVFELARGAAGDLQARRLSGETPGAASLVGPACADVHVEGGHAGFGHVENGRVETRHVETGHAGFEAAAPALVRAPRADGEDWVIVAPARSELTVNGCAVVLLVAALADRDEIGLGGGCVGFLSLERIARVEPLGPVEGQAFCPRCRQEIAVGSPVVRCTGCGVAYHQSDDFPCFTYGSSCIVCGSATLLDGELRWTPELAWGSR